MKYYYYDRVKKIIVPEKEYMKVNPEYEADPFRFIEIDKLKNNEDFANCKIEYIISDYKTANIYLDDMDIELIKDNTHCLFIKLNAELDKYTKGKCNHAHWLGIKKICIPKEKFEELKNKYKED